jgi:two-component system, NarL family, nitrate/nitrite response regulator NarL
LIGWGRSAHHILTIASTGGFSTAAERLLFCWEFIMKRRRNFAIILVGERGLLREGIERILRSANFRIGASAAPGDDLMASQIQADQLLFLIVHTGDDFDVEQIELLRNRHPNARVAIVVTRYRLDDVVAAFRAGVNGYFADVTSCEVFAKSVELVMMGEVVFPPAFLSFALVDDHHVSNRASSVGSSGAMLTAGTIDPRLSPRERSILRCLTEGDSNKCIARKIEIAEATVKVHIKGILRKIQVQNRTQAAIWGVNHAFLAEAPGTSLVPSNAGASGELPVPRNGGERQIRLESK